ncbi:hypothetical protein [Enterovibrio norvegicus]|uniref:hypothetical protein n=1 Tax=Enterovibrio norvegicus TaxID=188144 RepID=UPI00352C0CAE
MFTQTPTPEPLHSREQIRMHFYIDPTIAESDMNVLDELFVKFKERPDMFSRVTGPREHRIKHHVLKLRDGTTLDCDKKVYCTWNNSFHLRYSQVIHSLGFTALSQYIAHDKLFLIAREIEMTGAKPLSLKQAMNEQTDITK